MDSPSAAPLHASPTTTARNQVGPGLSSGIAAVTRSPATPRPSPNRPHAVTRGRTPFEAHEDHRGSDCDSHQLGRPHDAPRQCLAAAEDNNPAPGDRDQNRARGIEPDSARKPRTRHRARARRVVRIPIAPGYVTRRHVAT
jgi:hypothetical protein